MINEILKIDGMTCSSCVSHVTKALSQLPGVTNVLVDLDSATASLMREPSLVSVDDLIKAVDDEGYSASRAE